MEERILSGRIRTLLSIGAVVAVVAACSAEDLEDALGDVPPGSDSGEEDEPLPDDGDDSDDSDDAAAPADQDVSAVPDDLTDAYVAAVLAEWERLLGEAYRTSVAAGAITFETAEIVNVIAIDQAQEALYETLEAEAEASFDGQPSFTQRGARQVVDVEVVDTGQGCVVAVAELDVTEVLVEPDEPTTDIAYRLIADHELEDPDGINPMPWVMAGLDQGDDPDPDALGGCDD